MIKTTFINMLAYTATTRNKIVNHDLQDRLMALKELKENLVTENGTPIFSSVDKFLEFEDSFGGKSNRKAVMASVGNLIILQDYIKNGGHKIIDVNFIPGNFIVNVELKDLASESREPFNLNTWYPELFYGTIKGIKQSDSKDISRARRGRDGR